MTGPSLIQRAKDTIGKYKGGDPHYTFYDGTFNRALVTKMPSCCGVTFAYPELYLVEDLKKGFPHQDWYCYGVSDARDAIKIAFVPPKDKEAEEFYLERGFSKDDTFAGYHLFMKYNGGS